MIKLKSIQVKILHKCVPLKRLQRFFKKTLGHQWEYGEFDLYYHAVFESDAVLYLVFDMRSKIGRFTPKMTELITLKVNDREFQGTLWSAAKFEMGVLEIMPFVISPETEEEDEQTNY